MPDPTAVTDPIAHLLDRVHLGDPQRYEVLTLWPLQLDDPAGLGQAIRYVSLSTALREGSLHVDEVSEGGSVPHVRVVNKGDQAVLVLFGEHIVGAKQNRIANASFLVDAHSQLVIDVSCVEAGRWSRPGKDRFRSEEEVVAHSLRRKMERRVSESRSAGLGFRSDQAEVWDDVSEKLMCSRTQSPTSRYSDYRESRQGSLSGFEGAFHVAAEQIGFVATIAGTSVGVEVVGRQEVFASNFKALLRAYTIDAVEAALAGARPQPPDFSHPKTLLESCRKEAFEIRPSLGLGGDLRLAGSRVAGCALVHEGVVHLTAYPV